MSVKEPNQGSNPIDEISRLEKFINPSLTEGDKKASFAGRVLTNLRTKIAVKFRRLFNLLPKSLGGEGKWINNKFIADKVIREFKIIKKSEYDKGNSTSNELDKLERIAALLKNEGENISLGTIQLEFILPKEKSLPSPIIMDNTGDGGGLQENLVEQPSTSSTQVKEKGGGEDLQESIRKARGVLITNDQAMELVGNKKAQFFVYESVDKEGKKEYSFIRNNQFGVRLDRAGSFPLPSDPKKMMESIRKYQALERAAVIKNCVLTGANFDREAYRKLMLLREISDSATVISMVRELQTDKIHFYESGRKIVTTDKDNYEFVGVKAIEALAGRPTGICVDPDNYKQNSDLLHKKLADGESGFILVTNNDAPGMYTMILASREECVARDVSQQDDLRVRYTELLDSRDNRKQLSEQLKKYESRSLWREKFHQNKNDLFINYSVVLFSSKEELSLGSIEPTQQSCWYDSETGEYHLRSPSGDDEQVFSHIDLIEHLKNQQTIVTTSPKSESIPLHTSTEPPIAVETTSLDKTTKSSDEELAEMIKKKGGAFAADGEKLKEILNGDRPPFIVFKTTTKDSGEVYQYIHPCHNTVDTFTVSRYEHLLPSNLTDMEVMIEGLVSLDKIAEKNNCAIITSEKGARHIRLMETGEISPSRRVISIESGSTPLVPEFFEFGKKILVACDTDEFDNADHQNFYKKVEKAIEVIGCVHSGFYIDKREYVGDRQTLCRQKLESGEKEFILMSTNQVGRYKMILSFDPAIGDDVLPNETLPQAYKRLAEKLKQKKIELAKERGISIEEPMIEARRAGWKTFHELDERLYGEHRVVLFSSQLESAIGSHYSGKWSCWYDGIGLYHLTSRRLSDNPEEEILTAQEMEKRFPPKKR